MPAKKKAKSNFFSHGPFAKSMPGPFEDGALTLDPINSDAFWNF